MTVPVDRFMQRTLAPRYRFDDRWDKLTERKRHAHEGQQGELASAILRDYLDADPSLRDDDAS